MAEKQENKKKLYLKGTNLSIDFSKTFKFSDFRDEDRLCFSYINGWVVKSLKEGKKPAVRFSQSNAPFQTMMNAMKDAIISGTVTVDMAKVFIFHAFEDKPGVLQGDWKLFNRFIGRNTNKITMGNITYVKYEGAAIEWKEGPMIDKKEVAWMLFYLSIPHRNYHQHWYRCGFISPDQFDGQLKSLGAPPTVTAANIIAQGREWWKDRWYTALMISVYMFLCKFDTHEYATIRMGVTMPLPQN